MNFQELCDEVVLITKRPDLRDLIESRVRAATLKAHTKDFFYKDVVETGVAFPIPGTVTSFRPADLVQRYRKPRYIREWLYDASDPVDFGRGGKLLRSIDIANVRDSYGYFRSDVYYLAGDVIQIRSSVALSHILFGAYVYPDVTPNGYSSWIAEEMPGVIYHEAARQVLMSIGATTQAEAQAQMVAEAYQVQTFNGIPHEGE